MSSSIIFKPHNSNVTRVVLPSDDLSLIHTLLETKIDHLPENFFINTPFVLDCSNLQSINDIQLQSIKNCFDSLKLQLIGVCNHHFDDLQLWEKRLVSFDIVDNKPFKKVEASIEIPKEVIRDFSPSITQTAIAETKIVKGNIRSGQRIYAKDCDLTIMGSVGAGAEVIADGNINILGALRGRAFAGALGNNDCYIFCTQFAAELISIAGQYQNMEQLDQHNNRLDILIKLNKDETMSIESV